MHDTSIEETLHDRVVAFLALPQRLRGPFAERQRRCVAGHRGLVGSALVRRLALEGFTLLSMTEGIVPALEPAHAIGWLEREAGRSVPTGSTVLLNLSGRGAKDAAQVMDLGPGNRFSTRAPDHPERPNWRIA